MLKCYFKLKFEQEKTKLKNDEDEHKNKYNTKLDVATCNVLIQRNEC